MSYDQHLEERITNILNDKKVHFLTKKMFGGLCYMVDDKMCIGIVKGELMARVGEEAQEKALEKKGCKPMEFTGKPMKGYVFVEPEGIDLDHDLEYFIDLCLIFNPKAKSSKKKS